MSTIRKDVNVNTDSCNLSTKNSVAEFALFDSSARERPVALLQPTPYLRELFPHFDTELIARPTFFGRTEDGSHFCHESRAFSVSDFS